MNPAEETILPMRNLILGDDEQVKRIMLSLGITHLFQNGPSYGGRSCRKGEADITAYVHPDHPTHWIFFLRFEHSVNPADNGYAAYCFMKSEMSAEEFNAYVGRWVIAADMKENKSYVHNWVPAPRPAAKLN